jgi:ATP-dependent helicase/nuclease subunit B
VSKGPSPTVYTVPPGIAMVDALAAGLLDRCGDDLLALGDITVLLPTRRACRSLADAFLRRSDGAALLLPRLQPLGETDETEALFAMEEEPAGGIADLAPAIPDLQRRLALCRLILRTRVDADGNPPRPASATLLAGALADLLDEVQTQGLDFASLADLVSGDLATHWQITLDFLRVLTEGWPAVLETLGCLDPSARRNALLEAMAKTWADNPPPGPVIAAGSTGSIPATAALLDVIANLPKGMVILPGLDTTLSAQEMAAIGPTHPQFGMVRLIERIGIGPEDVSVWDAGLQPSSSPDRVALIRSALRPPLTGMEAVPDFDLEAALEGVSVLDCAGPQEEAGAIALALRHALESPGRTAALVTPDRTLARRVAAELRRWDIEIDDSAGRALASTPVGAFLRLVADCIVQGAAPVPLLSLLKHPLAAGGRAPVYFRAHVRALEISALRGPRPGRGFGGLFDILQQNKKAGPELVEWLHGLAALGASFVALVDQPDPSPFEALLDAHLEFVEALAATDAKRGDEILWRGDDGEAAAVFIAELRDAAISLDPLDGADYPAFFETLMAGRVVRPRYGQHPRLHVWGLLEARLQHVDLVCLGGLNEGTWPMEPAADPWMSRPMRTRFGLPPTERRIGLSAHDFAQSFCAEQVLITRAARIGGTPTVPARWLLRLDNELEAVGGAGASRRFHQQPETADWLGWQAAIDDAAIECPVKRPAPVPPVSARPRRLSVTQVETWMRDPYAIYARHILRLHALDPLDADPGAADRGTMIHDALDSFIRRYPDALPDDMQAALISAGQAAFGEALALPGVWAFWWPRYLAIADWFATLEGNYRQDVAKTHTEVMGALEVSGPAGMFQLIAKADRVDQFNDGTLSIIDYKTGATPRKIEIELGFAPQLPLEAALAIQGGFKGVPAAPVSCLEFWRLSGGDPPGERVSASNDIVLLATMAFAGLERLVVKFDDPATPYLSRPDPSRAPRFSDYEHLARVQEWSVIDGGGEE